MISVVIPLCNEEESLRELHGQLVGVLSGRPGGYEIIFVDDGSRDGSWRVISELAAHDSNIRAIRFRRNFGKACGLQTGFSAARGPLVFTLDADLQDDPAEIPRFIANLNDDGLDVISGWKRKRHDPWHKVGPSRVFNAMVSRLTGCRLHDHNCGFKLYRTEVVKDLSLYGELHRFIPVLAAARGFKVGEIEVNHRPRHFGHSKYGWNRMFKGFLDLLAVSARCRFGGRPMHLVGGTGIILVMVSLLLMLAGIGLWFWGCSCGPVVAAMGWMGFIGGGLFLAMGLAMEWNLARDGGGPCARPNVIDTIGEVTTF
ncbi:MAG: glycosyltransferase family 2 protein [Isosphaeraceae bacterium]